MYTYIYIYIERERDIINQGVAYRFIIIFIGGGSERGGRGQAWLQSLVGWLAQFIGRAYISNIHLEHITYLKWEYDNHC